MTPLLYEARDAMVDSPKIYDLIIVGGGVVGLAILRAATLEGWKCALVEAEPDLLSHASGSNSGIACTGVDATPGTLERALIRDSISQLRIFCKQHNIPTRACGSLVCLFPWDEADNLDLVLEESHQAGDTHASRLEAYKVKQLEPNLASSCKGGVHIPGEIVLDPWLYSISLAAHARENGADIFTEFPFDPEVSSFSGGMWSVFRKEKEGPRGDVPMKLQARAVANAAGLWADVVQSKGHGQSRWTAKPRRGQYRIYSSSETTRITHPIQPIPTQRTKGIFVFSTIYDQIVVGPTALDQDSKTDRSVDSLVAKELDEHAKRVIPELDTEAAFICDYVGIRPGTDKRDYQIHLFPSENWIAVAGIRSTGLTASLGIGDYVVRNLRSLLGTPKTKQDIILSPLPSLPELVRDFRDHDGHVNIHGYNYKVTHPVTKFGWKSIEDLASHDFPRL
jgi:glycerol-3-phosphate dehydrogenase